jgi:hypothetical protein
MHFSHHGDTIRTRQKGTYNLLIPAASVASLKEIVVEGQNMDMAEKYAPSLVARAARNPMAWDGQGARCCG